jgi:hypothetical protein
MEFKQKKISLKKIKGGIGKIKFALTFAPASIERLDGEVRMRIFKVLG